MPGPQILRTTRKLPTEVVELSHFLGVGQNGVVDYDTPVDMDAHVVKSTEMVTLPDGTQVRADVMLYVKGDSEVFPVEQDRINLADESTDFVVIRVDSPRGLRYDRDHVDHVRAMLRKDQ